MVSFIWILSLVLYAQFLSAESSAKLLRLECQGENYGVYGKDTLLKCSVQSSGKNAKILSASWRRPGEKFPLLMVFQGNYNKPADPRFSFAQSQLSGSTIDVSFLLRDTKKTDEGKYQCVVVTDSGEDSAVVSLTVTASYSKPEMSSDPEKEIQEDVEITMYCNASGGYPVGMIHWFDQYDTNWTRSAKTTSVETMDKRFNLSSKFTLRASSSSHLYRCSVLSSKGVKEGEAELELSFQEKRKGKSTENSSETADRNNTAIAAVIVVVGSLLCGLLILVLLRRRRAQQARRPSAHPILGGNYTDSSGMMDEGSAELNKTTEPALQHMHA